MVHDLASLNGTYLNHDRIDLAALSDGDELRVGAFRLAYYGSPRPAFRQPRPPDHPARAGMRGLHLTQGPAGGADNRPRLPAELGCPGIGS